MFPFKLAKTMEGGSWRPWIPIPPSPSAALAPAVPSCKTAYEGLWGISLMRFSSDPKATPPIFPNLPKSPQIAMHKSGEETKDACMRSATSKQKQTRWLRKQPSAPESKENRSHYQRGSKIGSFCSGTLLQPRRPAGIKRRWQERARL